MTELQILDGKSLEALAQELGATVGGSSEKTNASRLSQLAINSLPDDENGNPLPRGHFYIKGAEEIAFAETVTFRPLAHHFQYLHWDAQANNLANKTRIIASFTEEARDIKGTIRCGKPTSKVLAEMPEEARDRFADITCFRQVRGLVSYSGKTQEGKNVTITNQPVILMLKGTNFRPFEDEYLKALPRGRNIWDYQAKVTSKRHKNGSVTWFTFHFSPDLKTPLALDQATYESMGVIADAIRSENQRVDDAYHSMLKNQNLDKRALDALDSSLDADFEEVA